MRICPARIGIPKIESLVTDMSHVPRTKAWRAAGVQRGWMSEAKERTEEETVVLG